MKTSKILKTILTKKNYLITLLFFCSTLKTIAQDSLQNVSAEQVLLLVKKYHPIARQSTIAIESSVEDIKVARSAFDPLLNSYIAKKTFDGTNYYNYFSPEIQIPTWYGIDIVAGTENLTGNRLNTDVTQGKTNYVGINVPLLKSFVIDKRRAVLQQAKLFNTISITAQKSILNNIALEAMEAYWQWVNAYATYIVVKNNVQVNKKRVELVRKSYILGERPAIDTIEALSQLQSFQNDELKYYLQFQNAALELSAFLWKTNNEPYYLPENVIPQKEWENEVTIGNFNVQLIDLLDVAEKNHPDLKVYDYKLDILSIEKKLKLQSVLPKFDFTYNQLGKGFNLLKTTTTGPLFQNNFQYGLKLEMPLLLRKSRAEYQKAKLKIEETKLVQAQKKLAIQIKIKRYYNELVTLKKQITLQSANYANFQRLVKAEETRFFNGESSLFLINSRENKALEVLEKLIELKTKYYKTIYALQWSAGLL